MVMFFILMFGFLFISSFILVPLLTGYAIGKYEADLKKKENEKKKEGNEVVIKTRWVKETSSPSIPLPSKEKEPNKEETVEPPDFDGSSVSELEELLTPDDNDVISSEKYEEEIEAANEQDEIVDLVNNMEQQLAS